MSETDNRLNVLFQRYLANTCTREELEELLAALQNGPVPETLREAMEQHWLNSKNAPGIPDAATKLEHLLKSTRPEAAPWQKEVNAVPSQQDLHAASLLQEEDPTAANAVPGQQQAAPLRRPYKWQYAAAAVFILGLGITGYLYTKKAATPPAVTVHNTTLKQDIQPGGNKALLTLADGSTMALDSAEGRVVQQGNTAIRLQNGRLQYAVKGAATAASFNTLATPRGGQYQLVLPDGSKVWLNAASRLKYPTAFVGKERVVELEGQAYFEIAQKAGQPFKVHVHQLEVLALGTSFDIMAYDDEQTVNATLLNGAIKVSANTETRLLQPGQQAAIARNGNTIAVSTVNTDNVIAWKNGYFSFVDADIHTIMRQLSRWYDVEVSYEGGVPPGMFSGEIGKGLTLAQALKILEQARVHFKIENNRHIVILP